MRILINDHAGHPFQVQLSRKLAERGHKVLHTYCASVQQPRGALQKRIMILMPLILKLYPFPNLLTDTALYTGIAGKRAWQAVNKTGGAV